MIRSDGDDEAMAGLLRRTQAFVKDYMSHFDSSHDYAHITRVVQLATQLAESHPSPLSMPLVQLAAYLHDVGDSKYAANNAEPAPARTFLTSAGADTSLASSVQTIVSHVSFSREKRDPDAVLRALAQHPELGVVQDADRLDALGAVGIGRCFTYGASKAAGDRANGKACCSSMDECIVHFEEKLEQLGGMMKTQAGRELACKRTERIKLFKAWWAEETRAGEL